MKNTCLLACWLFMDYFISWMVSVNVDQFGPHGPFIWKGFAVCFNKPFDPEHTLGATKTKLFSTQFTWNKSQCTMICTMNFTNLGSIMTAQLILFLSSNLILSLYRWQSYSSSTIQDSEIHWTCFALKNCSLSWSSWKAQMWSQVPFTTPNTHLFSGKGQNLKWWRQFLDTACFLWVRKTGTEELLHSGMCTQAHLCTKIPSEGFTLVWDYLQGVCYIFFSSLLKPLVAPIRHPQDPPPWPYPQALYPHLFVLVLVLSFPSPPTLLNTKLCRSIDLPWIFPRSSLPPTDTHLRVLP